MLAMKPQGTLAAVPYQIPGWVCATVSLATRYTPQQCQEALRRMRTRAGISQGHLAALLGIDTTTLRRWEEGRRNPSAAARRLIQLVETLHFHPDRIGASLAGGVLMALFKQTGDMEPGAYPG